MTHRVPARAFTLVELLTVIGVIAVLASTLAPVFARARESARRSSCTSNLRQIGSALLMYVDDHDGRLPDRRDLKTTLPGGYRPWQAWPPSDPRCGWAMVVLKPWAGSALIWQCPSTASTTLGRLAQVLQVDGSGHPGSYWLWRFDRTDSPVAIDNLWGKTPDQSVDDLRRAANPQVGLPDGPADVEIAVDPYFPRTVPGLPADVRGLAVHFGGRSRLFLDGHIRYLRDIRTD